MQREEAKVGGRVRAWTAANGVYAGVLEAVVPRRPWRGRVRITGVIEPACVYDLTRPRPRRGFRPGDVIEVGGVNIRPLGEGEEGASYLEALERELARLEEWEARPAKDPKTAWVPAKALPFIRAAIDEERRRQGGAANDS